MADTNKVVLEIGTPSPRSFSSVSPWWIGATILLGAIIVALFVWGSRSESKAQKFANDIQVYKDSVVSPTLVYADSVKKVSDSLENVANAAVEESNKKTDKIRVLSSNLSASRGQIKTLMDSLRADTVTVAVCEQCRRAAYQLEEKLAISDELISQLNSRDTLRLVAIESLTRGLRLQSQRADSLQTIIINLPSPPGPTRVFGIKIPRIPPIIQNVAIFGLGVYVGSR